MESLTNDIEKKIQDSIRTIEALGDPADLSAKGWFKKFFEDSMERYHKDIESSRRIKVGTNIHQMPEDEDTMLRDVAEAKIQPYIWHVERIKRYKERRDQAKIKEVLLAVSHTAKETSDNLMDSILEAFEKGATCGEITGALRTAYDCPYDPYGKMTPPF